METLSERQIKQSQCCLPGAKKQLWAICLSAAHLRVFPAHGSAALIGQRQRHLKDKGVLLSRRLANGTPRILWRRAESAQIIQVAGQGPVGCWGWLARPENKISQRSQNGTESTQKRRQTARTCAAIVELAWITNHWSVVTS